MPIIEVDHVTKEFRLGTLTTVRQSAANIARRLLGQPVTLRRRFTALDDVSFTVEPGEVVGIIGHNGAGKSTMLKILAGITRPTKGAVSVHGRVAPLIEVGAGLVPDMTGRENIFLNATILGMRRAEIQRKFDEIVAFAELEEFVDTPVKRYSSGMQVRLGFSIATAVDSDVLIVDEVLAVGDLAFQRKCFDRMEDLIKRQGKTVLLVSHNIRQVERLCGRVLMLDHGMLLTSGPARSVCNAFYENSDKRIASTAKNSRRQNRQSTGEVELLEVSILDDDGRRRIDVEYRQDVNVQIRFLARKPLIAPIFVLGIHTTDFVNVATSTSSTLFRKQTLSLGEHELRVTLRDCLLLPGAYSFRFSVDVEEPIRNIFYCDGLQHFCVLAQESSRSSPESEGFFCLEADWQEKSDLNQAPSNLAAIDASLAAVSREFQ